MATGRPDPARELARQRALFRHLLHAQESERHRIAMDIHDDPLQAMAAVIMRMQLLQAKYPDEERAALDELAEAVTASVDRLRALVVELRPPGLDHYGLAYALRTYLDQVAKVTPIALELSFTAEGAPSDDMAVTLFRVVQAAVVGARRTAGVSAVDISVVDADHEGAAGITAEVRMRYQDATVHEAHEDDEDDPARDLAADEMRERARAVGGWWRMDGDPRRPDAVLLWVPAGQGGAGEGGPE